MGLKKIYKKFPKLAYDQIDSFLPHSLWILYKTTIYGRCRQVYWADWDRSRLTLTMFNLRERSSITSVCCGGWGWGLSQNADAADALEGVEAKMMTCWHFEGVRELKHRATITLKYLKLSINLWISSWIMP